MPKLTDDFLENGVISNNYGYSYTPVSELGADEYTLVTAAYDLSSSTKDFINTMNNSVKFVVNGLRDQNNPRADNTMLRLLGFNHQVSEFHGFQLVENCHPDNYGGIFKSGGATALYDTIINAIEATLQYSKLLKNNDFRNNAIVFVVTDGDDVCSKYSVDKVKEKIKEATKTEQLESLLVILIGVNVNDPHMSGRLLELQLQGGIDKYIELDKVDEKSLQKLAGWIVSQSLSQSQSLGSGGASQVLTF